VYGGKRYADMRPALRDEEASRLFASARQSPCLYYTRRISLGFFCHTQPLILCQTVFPVERIPSSFRIHHRTPPRFHSYWYAVALPHCVQQCLALQQSLSYLWWYFRLDSRWIGSTYQVQGGGVEQFIVSFGCYGSDVLGEARWSVVRADCFCCPSTCSRCTVGGEAYNGSKIHQQCLQTVQHFHRTISYLDLPGTLLFQKSILWCVKIPIRKWILR